MFEEKEKNPSFLYIIFTIIIVLCMIFSMILFFKILNDKSMLDIESAKDTCTSSVPVTKLPQLGLAHSNDDYLKT